MIYLIASLVAITVGLTVVLVAEMVPARSAAVARRLAEIRHADGSPYGRDRSSRRGQWEQVLQELGERVGADKAQDRELRKRLVMAGYGAPRAVPIFRGVRVALPIALCTTAFVAAPFAGAGGLLIALWLAAVGWIGPSFFLDRRMRARQKQMRLALPDALDLMVVCVEAGLGLNQAIVRVSEEIRALSLELSKELALVNLEIRAGTPREDALRNLGERTGVEDLRSLSTLLIQTERFGTSVAKALNVQSDTLRTKRRQRAEEEAAKLAVKMLLPLAFFIMPALFVIAIGPAAFSFLKMIGSF
ncbi:MAG TPA: type II secretion system F family protein [Longimicrobiaceae bacterium]|nr:type II secretion system F family protein [Longimicrobiaceae bacterium]